MKRKIVNAQLDYCPIIEALLFYVKLGIYFRGWTKIASKTSCCSLSPIVPVPRSIRRLHLVLRHLDGTQLATAIIPTVPVCLDHVRLHLANT